MIEQAAQTGVVSESYRPLLFGDIMTEVNIQKRMLWEEAKNRKRE